MHRISCFINLLLCAALLLTACVAPAAPAAPAAAEATAAPAAAETPSATEAPAADPNAVKAWPDPAIEGNLPENASYKDDFAVYANYDWYKTTKIPEGYSRWTTFGELDQKVKEQVLQILQSPGQSDAQQKAAALYASAMDTETRDAAGNSTLMRSFYFVQDVKTLEEMTALLQADGALYYFVPLLNTGVMADFKDSKINIAALFAPSLSLEDAAEYTARTEQGDRFKAANDAFYKALLTHNGVEEAEADKLIADAFAWEEKMAAGIYPLETSYRDDYYSLVYNVYTPEELGALSPDFPLIGMLKSIGFENAKRFMVAEPEAVKTLNALYTEENLPGFKAYLMINLLANMARYGDTFSEMAAIDRSNAKMGSTGMLPAEERAYNVCNAIMGEQLGLAYADMYFSEADKNEVTEIVNDAIDVYKARLAAADWLTDATRNTAIEKLETMTLRIGYPTVLTYDWENINFTADNPLIENVMNATMLMNAQTNAKADQPVNKELWSMSANTVNAYYEPSDNSINFPAAILQAPFYDGNALLSANLGGVGVVIAHEMTHAFDTTGSQFDKEGNMVNWWTDEDRAAFKTRTDAVAARYAAIEVLPGEHVKGDLTIGETVADLGGVTCALELMKAPENTDADYKAFFENFARVWRERTTAEYRSYLLKNDPHPPCYLRTDVTVQQFQEFYDTYDVQAGDFMYTAPADRLVVW